MKVLIDKDKWYPFWSVKDFNVEDVYWNVTAEIPGAEIERIQRVFEEFQEVQKYLAELEDKDGN